MNEVFQMCTKTELGYGLLDPIEKKLIEYLFPDLDCLPLANTEWERPILQSPARQGAWSLQEKELEAKTLGQSSFRF